ncbi:MAG: biofilm regulation phosphoprotein SiaC [Cyanobium sp.]
MTESDTRNLNLEATQYSPSVEADWETGSLRMNGESYPENTYEFFAQVIEWTESFLNDRTDPLQLELQLSYLNTSSIRAMIDIFDLLQDAAENGREVTVKWLYDSRNPRSAELGEEFKEDYTFTFDILAIGG